MPRLSLSQCAASYDLRNLHMQDVLYLTYTEIFVFGIFLLARKKNIFSIGLKADFQSSHEAPRSSLRVMHEHFHPMTMLKS